MLGRPGMGVPVFIRVLAGSWLIASVCIDNHREIINVLGKMREERGHLRAALAEFFKRKLRPQTGELLVLQLRDVCP